MSEVVQSIRQKYLALQSLLNESTRRRWAATEARALGWGGISKVSQATGINPATIRVGLAELSEPTAEAAATSLTDWSGAHRKGGYRSATPRIRAPGGGRKPVTATDPTLLTDLEALIEPIDQHEVSSPLRWTCKSTRELARALREGGHQISQQKVAELLRDLGFSLRSPSHVRGGRDQPDCNSQYQHLFNTTKEFFAAGQPVVVVETRKEPVVEARDPAFSEMDREAYQREKPGRTLPPDSRPEATGAGSMAEPAPDLLLVQSVRTWWLTLGMRAYPEAQRLLIAVAWPGSSRAKYYWMYELQQLADETGLLVHVSHLPAGTRKWSAGEQQLLSHTGLNWQGQHRRIWEVTLTLLASPARLAASRVPADLDLVPTRRGDRITPPEHRPLQLAREEFYGEWNYHLSPNTQNSFR
jgi:hypothetical protein